MQNDPGTGPSKGGAAPELTRQTALPERGGEEVCEEAERKRPHHPGLLAQLKWRQMGGVGWGLERDLEGPRWHLSGMSLVHSAEGI